MFSDHPMAGICGMPWGDFIINRFILPSVFIAEFLDF